MDRNAIRQRVLLHRLAAPRAQRRAALIEMARRIGLHTIVRRGTNHVEGFAKLEIVDGHEVFACWGRSAPLPEKVFWEAAGALRHDAANRRPETTIRVLVDPTDGRLRSSLRAFGFAEVAEREGYPAVDHHSRKQLCFERILRERSTPDAVKERGGVRSEALRTAMPLLPFRDAYADQMWPAGYVAGEGGDRAPSR